MLNKGIEIATRAHAGQVDKGGEPYIFHPLRVMLSQKNETERICAILHDVVEDSNITLDDLKREGFSEEILVVLDCLTKRNGESYDEFIGRILKNEIACHVKLADLYDNLNLSRIENFTYKDEARSKKYKAAAERIMSRNNSFTNLPKENIMKVKVYAAYGSNMNVEQMQKRCPKATVLGNGELLGYKLTFRGEDVGYANVEASANGHVPVVLWAITQECEVALDQYEEYPTLYKKEVVTIVTVDGEREVMLYMMTKPYEDMPALPQEYYFEIIRQGYQDHEISTTPLFKALENTAIEVK